MLWLIQLTDNLFAKQYQLLSLILDKQCNYKHESQSSSHSSGDSVVVEVDYPHCILDQDKIRLYSHSSKSLVRPKYLGEQRVVKVNKKNIQRVKFDV